MLFRESSPQHADSVSYTVTGLRPWAQYQFTVRTHNPAGHTHSPWVTVTTRQAPPRGLAPPKVSHLQGQPSAVLVSWTPPLEPNGILQSYRIERNNVSFSFSFDPIVLSYMDEGLLPFSTYRYCFAFTRTIVFPSNERTQRTDDLTFILLFSSLQLLSHSVHV